MNQEVFTDGIGNIQLAGGMVRIDFASLKATGEGQAVAPTQVQRMVMSPEGFLQSFGLMNQFAAKLIEAGVLKKTERTDKTNAVAEVKS
jgi:hypothetical protein